MKTQVNIGQERFLFLVGLLEYKAAKEWFLKDSTRYLFILEPDLDRFNAFRDSEIMNHPHFELLFLDGFDEGIKRLLWKAVFAESQLIMAAPFDEEHFYHLQRGIFLTASEYADYGAKVYRNVTKNLALKWVPKEKVKGRAQGKPAILCGAGPSLDSTMNALKTVGEKALLFGGGSALKLLENAALKCDFGAYVDPNPPRDRLWGKLHDDVPFFCDAEASCGCFCESEGAAHSFQGGSGESVRAAPFSGR